MTFVIFNEYLLDASEIDEFVKIMNGISPRIFSNLFKNIHSSKNQIDTIKEFLIPYLDSIVAKRAKFIPDLHFSI